VAHDATPPSQLDGLIVLETELVGDRGDNHTHASEDVRLVGGVHVLRHGVAGGRHDSGVICARLACHLAALGDMILAFGAVEALVRRSTAFCRSITPRVRAADDASL
jgi:hypothetical protein